MGSVYRGLTAAELDARYDIEAAVPELRHILADYEARNGATGNSANVGTLRVAALHSIRPGR